MFYTNSEMDVREEAQEILGFYFQYIMVLFIVLSSFHSEKSGSQFQPPNFIFSHLTLILHNFSSSLQKRLLPAQVCGQRTYKQIFYFKEIFSFEVQSQLKNITKEPSGSILLR